MKQATIKKRLQLAVNTLEDEALHYSEASATSGTRYQPHGRRLLKLALKLQEAANSITPGKRRRGTSNGNDRGNTKARATRKSWLMENWASDAYPRTAVRCYRCGCLITKEAVTIDRIVPGSRGGKYEIGNIRPACWTCNSSTAHKARNK